MKKILILLLCIFGLTLCYPQVRNVRVNMPSRVSVHKSSDYTICVLDSTISKYITMYYRDSTLYINSSIELTDPVQIRITSPDSLSITTGRNYKIVKR